MSRILSSTLSILLAVVATIHCTPAASCAGSCASSHQQFATITTYSSAVEYLQCQRDAGQLARVFDSDSLEAKHEKLTGQQCEPHVLIMIGRHAARSPDEDEIKQFNGDLTELVDLIRNNIGARGSISDKCLSRSQLLDAEYELEKFDIASDNLLTGVGVREQQQLASRLKQIYPTLFNATQTKIHLGTTSKLRTAQTATEFARAFDNFDLGAECKSSTDPTMDCYKHVLGAHSKIELEYHKVCKKQIMAAKKALARAGKPAEPATASEPLSAEVTKIFEKIAVLKLELLDKLAKKVSYKLGIHENIITRRHIQGAYNACRYELAAKLTSVWCDLFDSTDLSELDYLDDANIYHKISARLESNKLQACPIVKELIGQLAGAASAAGLTRREAYFGFTHVGVLKKILAVFGMFDADQNEGYTEADLNAFERAKSSIANRQLAQNRQWRTSLMVPFSANVNFVLYKCPLGKSRILTTISEQPVRVRGCSDSACPASEFLANYGHLQLCDPGKVCEEVAKSLGEDQKDE